jgi:HD superfamily phosphohydrolase
MGRWRWLVMADPIHGMLQFDREDPIHRLILDVMNSRAFQRLRRVRQMGLAEFVFPGAVHSRFMHSIGATHLMNRAIDTLSRNPEVKALLESHYPETRISLRCLMLLGILVHDMGHPPLSHTLEDILELKDSGLDHDHYWLHKILTDDPDLQAIWAKFDPALPETLIHFLGGGDGQSDKHFLATLVSSQLDMDRLDYLLRDSHFLGVKYGQIEADRIISSLELTHRRDGTPVVAVREDATPAIEHYLFGRHQAYKMALHSLDKASEALLKKVLQRFCWVRQQNIETGHAAEPLFQLMTGGQTLSTSQYLRMDDYYLWEAIHCWSLDAEDPLLKQLARRMHQHDLLKFVDLAPYGCMEPLESLSPVYDALRAHYEKRGLSFEFGFDQVIVRPKPLYQVDACREPIWVSTANHGVVDLRDVSSLPLSVPPARGEKNLVFVWDGKAKRFLDELLESHFRHKPEPPARSLP